jgi:DNA-binding transcriptional MocR family regulator
MQYSKSQGNEALREKIASLYTNKYDFPTSKDEILITTGSQQAFDIIAKTFFKDEVIVQSPSYLGALSAFRILGLEIKEFEEISSLENSIKESSGLYLMSDFINPTTKCLSKKERKKILELLNIKKPYIIEDAAYLLLDFNGKIRKSISSNYEKSFHLGSFSKIVAPGLRVGWIRAKKELLDELLVSKEALDLHTSTFNQMLLNEYLQKNDLFAHLEVIRKDYKQKMEFMSSCFKKYLPNFKFKKPKGGMFIYGEFPEDSFAIAKKALEKNIAFVPGSVFYSDKRVSTKARFNFSNATKKEIKKGLKELGKLRNLGELF